MPNPSPATAAIVKAFDDRYEIAGFDEDWQEVCIAAALRALADNAEYAIDPQTMGEVAVVRVDDIMARVDELEGS